MLILMAASLSCATIAWCCPLCPMPRRRNILAFCPTTAHSLFAPQFSFAHPPQQSGSQLDVQKATGQIANAQRDLFFPRVPRQQRLWWKLDVCERYPGGVVKPSEATFALTFATPCAVSPAQLVLPEGGKGGTRHGHTHPTYGI